MDARSEDTTKAIVRSYSDKLTLHQIDSERRNLSVQRNMGAKLAHGEYLIFIDADSRIPQATFLSKLATECSESRFLLYAPAVRTTYRDPGLRFTFALYNKAVEASQLFTSPLPTPGLGIIQRDFFRHLGGYLVSERHDKNVLFAEDHDLLTRARKSGVLSKAVKSVHYVMSLRRYEREGWVKVVSKLLLAAIEQSVGKEFIESEYEMGGHMYKEEDNESTPT